jgi:hypothetical protein
MAVSLATNADAGWQSGRVNEAREFKLDAFASCRHGIARHCRPVLLDLRMMTDRHFAS